MKKSVIFLLLAALGLGFLLRCFRRSRREA